MEYFYNSLKRRVFSGLDHLTREARVASWLILLEIDIESPQVEQLRFDYLSKYMIYQTEPGSEQDKVEK